jgi:hypothetical protein
MRYMLRTMGHGAALNFHHDQFEFYDGTKPAHDFSVEARLARYGNDLKLVYIERDPRDVMVSLYHQITGRLGDIFNYGGDISAFIRDPYFGAEVHKRFRAMWNEILAQRPFLRVRYEDMHQDTARELERVLRYLGLPADAAAIAAGVEAGRIGNMREVELEGKFDEPWLRPRNGFTKVRRGEVGSFRAELSDADAAYLCDVFGLS